jgi:hypothetical protein
MMATSAITKIEKLEPNGKVFFIYPHHPSLMVSVSLLLNLDEYWDF